MAAPSRTPNLDRLGLKYQREDPDGTCWFYAVARQLYGDPGQAQRLRNELAAHFDVIARDPARSEEFVYPNGRYDRNAAGNPYRADRNMPALGLKAGNLIPAMGIYRELEIINGFIPPRNKGNSTPQEIVQAYANSLRTRMYAGDIESSLIHRLHGVTVRIFTRRGRDVVHTRSFDNVPDDAPRPDFYRRCFPPECINLLYNGVNHYDSLILDEARVAAAAAPALALEDPNVERARELGMTPERYRNSVAAQRAANNRAAATVLATQAAAAAAAAAANKAGKNARAAANRAAQLLPEAGLQAKKFQVRDLLLAHGIPRPSKNASGKMKGHQTLVKLLYNIKSGMRRDDVETEVTKIVTDPDVNGLAPQTVIDVFFPPSGGRRKTRRAKRKTRKA